MVDFRLQQVSKDLEAFHGRYPFQKSRPERTTGNPNTQYSYENSRPTCGPAVFCFIQLLVLNVWHEGHKAGALHCRTQVTLCLSREASAAATEDTCVGVYESTKTGDVLVVDVFDGSLLMEIWSFYFVHSFKLAGISNFHLDLYSSFRAGY